MDTVEGLLLDFYPWTLALHLISVISWMAGLLYLPRLFVYHVDNSNRLKESTVVFETMERKLLRGIMNPAMVLTWIFGLCLVFTPGLISWADGWVWVKAIMVSLLTVYHHYLGLWRKDLLAGRNTKSGRFFRVANEVPAVLMIVVVLMVIGRPF